MPTNLRARIQRVNPALLWLATVLAAIVAVLLITKVYARDLDGKYAASPLKGWFDSLKSQKGLCCSFADGKTVTDADWETRDNHYIVKLDDGNWYDVPAEAVVEVPNKFGQVVVWPYVDSDNKMQIRCFLPGAGT